MLKRLVFASIFMLAFFAPASAREADSRSIAWHKDYDSALKIAREQGRPILMDFWADWCKPCKAMDQEVWPQARVVALAERFVCVSVDIDRDKATSNRYSIRSIPAVVFADPWGNPITIRVGYTRAADLTKVMEVIPSDYTEVKDSFANLEEDEKDGQALARIGMFYHKNNVVDLSNLYYKRALKSKVVKSDPDLCESIMVALGVNYLRMGKHDDARKTFEQCLKQSPDGKQSDKAMLGIVLAHVSKGKLEQAEQVFGELRSKYPESAATQQAAKSLEQAKSQQK